MVKSWNKCFTSIILTLSNTDNSMAAFTSSTPHSKHKNKKFCENKESFLNNLRGGEIKPTTKKKQSQDAIYLVLSNYFDTLITHQIDFADLNQICFNHVLYSQWLCRKLGFSFCLHYVEALHGSRIRWFQQACGFFPDFNKIQAELLTWLMFQGIPEERATCSLVKKNHRTNIQYWPKLLIWHKAECWAASLVKLVLFWFWGFSAVKIVLNRFGHIYVFYIYIFCIRFFRIFVIFGTTNWYHFWDSLRCRFSRIIQAERWVKPEQLKQVEITK